MKDYKPVQGFKKAIVEWSACKFDLDKDIMLLYPTPTNQRILFSTFLFNSFRNIALFVQTNDESHYSIFQHCPGISHP
jgi:hypothetical protein